MIRENSTTPVIVVNNNRGIVGVGSTHGGSMFVEHNEMVKQTTDYSPIVETSAKPIIVKSLNKNSSNGSSPATTTMTSTSPVIPTIPPG